MQPTPCYSFQCRNLVKQSPFKHNNCSLLMLLMPTRKALIPLWLNHGLKLKKKKLQHLLKYGILLFMPGQYTTHHVTAVSSLVGFETRSAALSMFPLSCATNVFLTLKRESMPPRSTTAVFQFSCLSPLPWRHHSILPLVKTMVSSSDCRSTNFNGYS